MGEGKGSPLGIAAIALVGDDATAPYDLGELYAAVGGPDRVQDAHTYVFAAALRGDERAVRRASRACVQIKFRPPIIDATLLISAQVRAHVPPDPRPGGDENPDRASPRRRAGPGRDDRMRCNTFLRHIEPLSLPSPFCYKIQRLDFDGGALDARTHASEESTTLVIIALSWCDSSPAREHRARRPTRHS